MRDHERHDRLERVKEYVAKLLEPVAGTPRHLVAVRKLDEFRAGGFASKSQMVSDVHQARGVHDPTGLAATKQRRITTPEGRPCRVCGGKNPCEVEDPRHYEFVTDVFDQDRAMLDEHIEAAYVHALKAAKIAVRHSETANAKAIEPSCDLCDELGRTRTVFADKRCRWHYDFRAEWGEDAHAVLGRMHLDQRKITEQMVRQWHPDARRRAS